MLLGDTSSTHWQIAFGTILTVGMVTATFTQFALGALGPYIIDDFAISRTGFGFLSTAVAVTTTALSPIAGRLADSRFGHNLLLLVFAMGTAALVVMALAPSFGWLLVAVVLAGISQAASNPSTNKMISAYALQRNRGVLIGVKQSGVYIGGVLAGSLLPLGASVWGWRKVIAATVLLPAVSFLMAHRLLPANWPAEIKEDRPSTEAIRSDIHWLMIYAFLMGGGMAVVIAYVPLYANQRLGVEESIAGLFIAVLGITGVVSRIIWARLSERVGDVSLVLGWLSFIAVAMLALVWSAENLGAWVLLTGSVGLGASGAAWNAVGMLAIVKDVGFSQAGVASGLVSVGFFGGYILSPTLFGLLVDVTGAYHFSWALSILHFLAAGIIAMAWRRARATRSVQALGEKA